MIFILFVDPALQKNVLCQQHFKNCWNSLECNKKRRRRRNTHFRDIIPHLLAGEFCELSSLILPPPLHPSCGLQVRISFLFSNIFLFHLSFRFNNQKLQTRIPFTGFDEQERHCRCCVRSVKNLILLLCGFLRMNAPVFVYCARYVNLFRSPRELIFPWQERFVCF